MTTMKSSILNHFPPMGIYEVLFSFLDSAGVYMGEPGTHPWAQGFPLTKQLPGGPELPDSVSFDWSDRKYPSASGNIPLLEAIRDYYNEFYDAGITTDNICVFAGGRPGIFATVAFLAKEFRVFIEETEYTPYYDLLKILDRDYTVVPSNEANKFRPTTEDYRSLSSQQDRPPFMIKSNPCNPTGVAWAGDTLKEFVEFCSQDGVGAIIDEAYEFFKLPEPESCLRYIEDINATNIFVIGAATKGLQVPGARVGWVVSSEANTEIFRNYSSIGMGGVSRFSQIYVTQLLELERVRHARMAVAEFFGQQRDRYRVGLEKLGIELFTGDGGFYHWGKLPGSLTSKELNERLYKQQAAILPGKLCDMLRRGDDGTHGQLFRFSFGPLSAESYEADMELLASCLEG